MKVVFFGTPELAVPSLEILERDHRVALVVTQPDRPRGRGRRLSPPPVKSRALELGLPVWQPERLRDEEDIAPLRKSGAGILVVVAYGLKLPDRVLDLAPEGAVNLHFSLLPAYRGAAPINWAIINGETTTGLSTFRLTSRMDGGPLLLQRTLPIAAGETAGELGTRLAEAGAALLAETVAAVEKGSARALPQPESGASRAPKLRKEDGRIDWGRPAGAVVNLVRGVNPWPGAYSTLGGRVVKIWRAEACPPSGAGSDAAPGTVLSASPRRGFIVAAGDGALSLIEVQAAGKKRTDARSFLAGHPVAAGERFA